MSILQQVLQCENEALLRQLNKLICSKLNSMQDNQSMNAMSKLSVGQEVTFASKNGVLHGTIKKFNQKTVSVSTHSHGEWRVSAGLVTPK